jgi:hypothetical protein
MGGKLGAGFLVPDGNQAIKADIPAIVDLIVRNARWVNPETFRRLPVWCPHTARGQPLYNFDWSRRYTNTRKITGVTLDKTEGNVAALKTLVSALDVATPKPSHWTVCHIWGYDDPSFSQSSAVVQDPKYFTCIANMIWLPTSLKGFTDTVPEIKDMLRVCSFYLYGWACEHPVVAEKAEKIRSGWVPDAYPALWPSSENSGVLPPGVAPFSKRVDQQIEKIKKQIKLSLKNSELLHYPRDQVTEVLKFWKIEL